MWAKQVCVNDGTQHYTGDPRKRFWVRAVRTSLRPYWFDSHWVLTSNLNITVCEHHFVWASLCEHHIWISLCVNITVCEHQIWKSLCVNITVCEHHFVWTSNLKALCVNTTVCEHHCVWTSACLSITVCEHQRVWTSLCVNISVCEHYCVWTSACVNISVHLVFQQLQCSSNTAQIDCCCLLLCNSVMWHTFGLTPVTPLPSDQIWESLWVGIGARPADWLSLLIAVWFDDAWLQQHHCRASAASVL